MLPTTHILTTLILSRVLSLSDKETVVALIAGAAVDLDHLFTAKKWSLEAKKFFRFEDTGSQGMLHSWIQEPLFGAFIGIITGMLITYFWPQIRWWVFPGFLLVHIAMDAVMNYEHRPFIPLSKFTYRGWIKSGTRLESILALTGVGILLIFLLIKS